MLITTNQMHFKSFNFRIFNSILFFYCYFIKCILDWTHVFTTTHKGKQHI